MQIALTNEKQGCDDDVNRTSQLRYSFYSYEVACRTGQQNSLSTIDLKYGYKLLDTFKFFKIRRNMDR